MMQDEGRLVVGAAAPGAPAAARLAWVDNLKIAVIAGVVVVHAAATYVLDVDWYYMERTTSGLWEVLLGLPMLGAPFVLGPLFLLGGMFAAASLARKGPGRFVHGRLLRLGVPLVVFVAVLSPLTNYLGDLGEGRRPRVWPYLAWGRRARFRAAVVCGCAAGLQPGIRRLAMVPSGRQRREDGDPSQP